ncbi:MAG: acyl-CoA dehydrogenase [Nocardioidaceae bacterium]
MKGPSQLGPIDVPALSRLLDGDHVEVRTRVREQLATYAGLVREAPGLTTADYRARVLDVLHNAVPSGLTRLGFPKEYGGSGDIGGSIAAFETLALGDLSVLVKFGVQFGLFGGAILHLGSAKHHERYLEDVMSGRLLGCFAMTETGHGSNVQALRTTATYDSESSRFVVHTPDRSARKDYIGNSARDGELAVVFAQLEVGGEQHGVHAILVPIRDADGAPLPGVQIEDCGQKLGLNGVDNGRLTFERVAVPRDNLLDRYAQVDESGSYASAIDNPDRRFFTMLGTLVQGRVSVGGGALGAAKVALALATRYALQRRQFGAPGAEDEALLMDYRVHQRRLLPLVARTYALHFAQAGLVSTLHRVFSLDGDAGDAGEHERRELESAAAGIKALTTWHATQTIQTCREACGGAGYLSANRFGMLKADTDVFTTFEGDNTVLLQLVAKGLLTDYRDSFEQLDPIGMARYVAGLAVESVAERTSWWQLAERLRDAVPGGDDDNAGLLDREYHLAMYRWRDDHVRSAVARRLKRGIDRGDDAFDVFSSCQDHVVLAARVHVERVVLEAFAEAVDSCPDGPQQMMLSALCDLSALGGIEHDRGWFQEHGRLSGERSKAITTMVGALCEELRPHARDLVDAFGIPEELLDVEMLR